MLQAKLLVPTFFATLMLVVFYKFSPGNSAFYTSIPAMIFSYIFYLKTVYQKAPASKKILPLYLLGVCWYPVHFAEEFINNYATAFPAMFKALPIDPNSFLIFNMVAMMFFVFAAIAIYLKIQGPQLIAIFFIVFGMIVNAITHIFFQIKTGNYFPGFYTALPYLIAPIGIWLFWKETR